MLDGYGFLDGDYQISTEVDGKPSWINNDYAIWYKSIHNSWFIGDSNDIGQSLCYLYAYNDFSDPTADDNQWFYWNGNSWTSPSNPEDISIDAFMINDTLNPFLNMSTLTEEWNSWYSPHQIFSQFYLYNNANGQKIQLEGNEIWSKVFHDHYGLCYTLDIRKQPSLDLGKGPITFGTKPSETYQGTKLSKT